MSNDYEMLRLRQQHILRMLGWSQSYFERVAFSRSDFMARAKTGNVTVAKLAEALELTELLCQDLCEMASRADNIMIAKHVMKEFHARRSGQRQPGEPATPH